MTRSQENKLSMWTTTHALLGNNETIWKNLEAFAEAVDLFRQIRLGIDPHAGKQQSNDTGITEDKQRAIKEMTGLAMQLARNMEAYAIKTKNAALQKQFELPPSQFDRMRDNTLPILVKTILDKAKALSKELVPYGTTDATIDALKESLDQYGIKTPNPKLASNNRKEATGSIAQKIKDGEVQLKLMDNMVGNFKNDHPAFVVAYHDAREIINLGGGGKRPPNTPSPPSDKE
jgi:hypothetical protein